MAAPEAGNGCVERSSVTSSRHEICTGFGYADVAPDVPEPKGVSVVVVSLLFPRRARFGGQPSGSRNGSGTSGGAQPVTGVASSDGTCSSPMP